MLPSLLMAYLKPIPAFISVADFGAKPNSRQDATALIAAAIAAAKEAKAGVDFPAGDYHFYRENAQERTLFLSNSDVVNPRKISILIEGQKGLRLRGKGVRLIFHDRVIPFAILNSQDVSLEGFTVDWERPLMSQGLVRASDRTGFTLEIDQTLFPYTVADGQLTFTDKTWQRKPWGMMEFEPSAGGVAYGTGDAGFTDGNWRSAKVSEPTPGQVRFDFPSTRGPAVGNVLVIRHGTRDHAGAFIQDSRRVKFSNVAFRHTSGLGVLAQYSEDLTFNNVEVAPDPKSGRMFAGHDDGFHFSNCKGQISVDHCKFEGLMDDPINVHGTAVRVTKIVNSTTLECRFMHDQSVGLRFADPGDTLSLLDHDTMLSRQTCKVKTMNRTSPQDFQLTFEEPVPDALVLGDALENLTWTPAFSVRNSIFGRVRARGLLVSTPQKVVVEDNVFRSSGAAILIAGDANYWFESGAVRDVTIRRNRFENCNTSSYQFGDAVISIHPEIPKLTDTPFHRNIRIEDNTFLAFDAPLLWAHSTGDLIFRNNKVIASTAYKPWHPNKEGLAFLGCENVLVEGNTLERGFLGLKTRVEGGKPSTIQVKDWH